MSTEAQIEANRANAQKSTGPRTPEGKAVVAQNALKHGLLARQAVIAGEDTDDYELLRDQLDAEMAPVGLLESRLVERIAGLLWRLQRAERLHNETFDMLHAQCVADPQSKRWRPASGPDAPDPLVGLTVVNDFSETRVMEHLFVHERRIEYSLCRMMAELRKLQGQRQAATGVPATSPGAAVRDTHLADLSTAGQDRRERRSGTVRETLPAEFTLDNLLVNIAALEDEPAGAATKTPAEPACEAKPISESPRAEVAAEPVRSVPVRAYDGVTTNVAAAQGQSCETKPIRVGLGGEQSLCGTGVRSDPASRGPGETKPISVAANRDQGGYTPVFRRRGWRPIVRNKANLRP